MARRNPIAWVLIFGTSFSTYGADTNELKERRVRAADAFSKGILLVHARPSLDDAADGFRQDPIFFYFTGLENTAGAILAIDGQSREGWLFLPTHPNSPLPAEGVPSSDAVKRAGIEHVADWSELQSLLAIKGASALPLYYLAPRYYVPDLPPNLTPGNNPGAPLWLLTISQKWPKFELQEVRTRVNSILNMQSASEMVSVRAAAKATVEAIMAGIRAIKPGVSQRDVETAVNDACWKAGAHGAGFWPWAMTGTNSVFPRPFGSFTRYDHLNSVMNSGDLVRLDIGCESDHYSGDLGRTVPVSGHYSEEQREIWDLFVDAYQAGVGSLRQGVTKEQVFDSWSAGLLQHRSTAKSALARQAIEEWSKRSNIPYWQIHTMNLVAGSISGPLSAGTTIDFEPIASIAGQGYYLEDMFVITPTGAELLTPHVPYSASEIEAAMQGKATSPRSRR
jgi:Xaa-Pro aminopeptidase